MTEAVAVLWPEDGEYSLTVRGHATGSEQVCAAVSGLVYSLAGYLANDDSARIQTLRTEPGDTEIRWTGGDGGTLAAFQTVCIGLLQIEKAEPKYLATKISENIFKFSLK